MEPSSTIAAVVGMIKAYGATLIGVTLGALTNRGRPLVEHVTAIVSGVAFSLYVIPAIVDFAGIKSVAVINGLTCLGAIFALTLIRTLALEIPKAVAASRAKFIGGDTNVSKEE